ncbi:nicotinic acid mononucleotide adenyltransferase [Gangjinia marincola]
MKTVHLLSGFWLMSLLFTSCYVETVTDETIIIEEPVVTLNDILSSYELWYVDIEQTTGQGEVSFLQRAFTVSFRNGTVHANNNLVGIGEQGNGFGIPIGTYDTFGDELEIIHDLDGFMSLHIDQVSSNLLRFYDTITNTSYVLLGYQRDTFDYDYVFYENMHYFLQEYEVWEKIHTSDYGDVNLFDDEHYIQFLPFGRGDNFRSSVDVSGTSPQDIFWDYEGHYEINDVAGNPYIKTLSLFYDPMGDELFEVDIINDQVIELFHVASGTDYQFTGRGYIQYKTEGIENGPKLKKRMKKAEFKELTAKDVSA